MGIIQSLIDYQVAVNVHNGCYNRDRWSTNHDLIETLRAFHVTDLHPVTRRKIIDGIVSHPINTRMEKPQHLYHRESCENLRNLRNLVRQALDDRRVAKIKCQHRAA